MRSLTYQYFSFSSQQGLEKLISRFEIREPGNSGGGGLLLGVDIVLVSRCAVPRIKD